MPPQQEMSVPFAFCIERADAPAVEISLSAASNGLVASAVVDYIGYVSDVVDAGKLNGATTVQLAELHRLFQHTLTVGRDITLQYDVTVLDMQLVFVMKKKPMTEVEELRIECKR